MLNEQNKRAFIHNVSLALGRNDVPTSVEPYDFTKGIQHHIMSEVQGEEATYERFKVECEKLSIIFTETTPENLKDTILKVIKDNGGGKVIYPSVEQMDTYGIKDVFLANDGKDGMEFIAWDPEKGRELNIHTAQDANIGITFPAMAIAETATLVQPMTSGSGRCVGLLPLTHIAVVRRSTIKRRMSETMVELRKKFKEAPSEFPSAIVHISGPSSTSDIELVRVVGAHGPINITYIIVND